MKKWLCMVLCIGMMFGATGCGDTGTGTVENKEVSAFITLWRKNRNLFRRHG